RPPAPPRGLPPRHPPRPPRRRHPLLGRSPVSADGLHPDPPLSGPPVGAAPQASGAGARGYPYPLLVSVGDLMVDVAVEAPALARGGDVAGAVRLGAGGSAANVAAWGGAAGGRARLVAGRGDDLAGRLLAAAVGERGVELHPAGPVAGGRGGVLGGGGGG